MNKSNNFYYIMAKVKRVSVGGQALIEGILMKGPKGSAMALRLPDGTIEVEEKNFPSIKDKYKFFGFPIIRGVTNFVESMVSGYKCLMESAEKVSFEEYHGLYEKIFGDRLARKVKFVKQRKDF